MWSRDRAIYLITNIQPELMAKGWFVALAGGVLTRGWSDHDLDLVAVPMDSTSVNVDAVRDVLARYGYGRTHDANDMRNHWRTKGSTDNKVVEVFSDGCKRIDVIYTYTGGF